MYFSLNKKNKPDGIWKRKIIYPDDSVIYKEECYSEGELMKRYTYYYNTSTKERVLDGALIYYPKKDFTYKVGYSYDGKNSAIKEVYFSKDKKDYFFILDSKNKVSVVVGVGLILDEDKYPDSSLYEVFKREIEKVTEIN